jgi:hypothetical protein
MNITPSITLTGGFSIKPNYESIQKTLKDRFGLDDPKYNQAFEILINEKGSKRMPYVENMRIDAT